MGLGDWIKNYLDRKEQPIRERSAFNLPTETIIVGGLASFKLAKIEGGTFWMGATSEQGNDAYDNEKPCHQVSVGSFLASSLIDSDVFNSIILGYKHAYNSHPAYCSWHDCQNFIYKLNGITGKHFRLPTEAEWEFVARGGCRSMGYKFIGGNQLQSNVLLGNRFTIPNELNFIFSMWEGEWCQDIFGPYDERPQNNPTGASSGFNRVLRYGRERVSKRGYEVPSRRGGVFRLVLPCNSFSFGKTTKV